MRAARGSYRDAIGWLRSARPGDFSAHRAAVRMLDGAVVAGLVVMGSLGLLTPSRFGDPGAKAARSGWPWWLLLGVVAICVALVVAHRRTIAWSFRRFREPFVRPLEEEAAFEGAAGALGSTAAPLRTRFAFGWVWLPALGFVFGTMLAFSAAYFAVDAILARFQVGWQQPILGVANLALSLIVFRLIATRLATWRVALSAVRDATGRY